MNKQTEDKILEMLLHTHEKSSGAYSLDPQKDGVQWWIKCCGGSRSLRTQICYMGIDAYSAEEFWPKYGHDEILPREHLFRFSSFPIKEMSHCHMCVRVCVCVNAIQCVCVCVSMQSIQYCSSHLLHMDIFSGLGYVQQRAQTPPSSSTTSSSSLSSSVGAVHTCAGTCSHGPYGGYRTCLRIKNCCKCKSMRTYSCNSVPDPLHMFLTMPQCHMRANKCSIRAL